MAGKTTYTPEIANKICSLLADGLSLRAVCRMKGMPTKTTVFKWLNEIDGFSDQYARAKDECADNLVEEMLQIADEEVKQPAFDGEGNPVVDANGEQVMTITNTSVAHARLRVDTRKWYASKLKPKKYGEKVDVSGGMSISINLESDTESL